MKARPRLTMKSRIEPGQGDQRAQRPQRLAAGVQGDDIGGAFISRAEAPSLRPCTPVAWASSSISMASCARRQRHQIAQRGAVAIHGIERFRRDPDLAAAAAPRANALIASRPWRPHRYAAARDCRCARAPARRGSWHGSARHRRSGRRAAAGWRRWRHWRQSRWENKAPLSLPKKLAASSSSASCSG